MAARVPTAQALACQVRFHHSFTLSSLRVSFRVANHSHYLPMSVELSERPAPPAPREITTKPRRSDQIFRTVVTVGGMASLVILGLIALFLSLKGAHVLVDEKFGFITGSAWEAITDETGNIVNSNLISKNHIPFSKECGFFFWALPQLPLSFQLRSGIPLQVLAKFRFRYTCLWALRCIP